MKSRFSCVQMRVLMRTSEGVRRHWDTSGSSANSESEISSVSGMGGRGLGGCWWGSGGEGGLEVDASANCRAEVGSMFIGSTKAAAKSASRGGTAVLLTLGPRRRLAGGSEVAFAVDVPASNGGIVVDVFVADAFVAGSVAA